MGGGGPLRQCDSFDTAVPEPELGDVHGTEVGGDEEPAEEVDLVGLAIREPRR